MKISTFEKKIRKAMYKKILKSKFTITGYEESTRSSSSGGDDDDNDSRRPPPGAGVGFGTGPPTGTSPTSDFRSQDPKEGSQTKHPKSDLSKHSTPRQEHISHRGAADTSPEQASQAPSGDNKKHSPIPGKAEPGKQSGMSDTKDDKSKMPKAASDFPLELMDVEPSEREADAESYDTSLPPSASQTGRHDRDP